MERLIFQCPENTFHEGGHSFDGHVGGQFLTNELLAFDDED